MQRSVMTNRPVFFPLFVTLSLLVPVPLPSAQAGLRPPPNGSGRLFVALRIELTDGRQTTIVTKEGTAASVDVGGRRFQFVPEVTDVQDGRVEISVGTSELHRSGAAPEVSVSTLHGKLGFSSYVPDPLLFSVRVEYAGASPHLALPFLKTACSAALKPAGMGCCLECDGINSCGCAVGGSCGSCCAGCCRN